MRFLICFVFALSSSLCSASGPTGKEGFLGRLQVVFSELRVISPVVLELTLVTAKKPDPARPDQWDFVDERNQSRLPAAQQFAVLADGKTIDVKSVGCKRRV